MKKKLIPILAVVLIGGGGAYKFALAKPAPVKKPKVSGEVYVLPKDFMINLEGGQFAKLGVALVVKPHEPAGGGGHGTAAPKPPEGYGLEPQEALIRGIVTDVMTGESAAHLRSKKGRRKLAKEILERLHHDTDVHAEQVVFTDVAVQ